MKILLLGGRGQIGSDLRSTLPLIGNACPVDRKDLDLARPDTIVSTINKLNPDLIINAAAYTQVDRAESEPDLALAVNGTACAIIAEQAKRLGCPLIHYSTDYVFDGAINRPYRPEDAPNPLSVYGKTKLAGERAIVESGCSHLIFRTSWIYSRSGHNFLHTMLRLAENQSVISVVHDQIGSPTWSHAIARATTEILQKTLRIHDGRAILTSPGGIYHLTSPGQTTWCGFARKIFALANLPRPPRVDPISTDQYPTPAPRPAWSVLDCSQTEQQFGVALAPWEDSLTEYFAHNP